MQADQETQVEMEHLYNKNQVMDRLDKEFRIPEVIAHCDEHQIDVTFGVRLLSQMVLHRKTELTTMIGLLWRLPVFENAANPFQACTDMLDKAIHARMVYWDDFSLYMALDVAPTVHEELERYQYPLPMVVEPRHLETNFQGAYLTWDSSVILKAGNHHEDDVCLDHLNRQNKVRYTINETTARMIQNSWKSIDRRKPGETQKDFMARRKAFEKYDRTARDVMDHLIMHGNEFWLSHRYDKRGRSYCQGYHVNTQGNAWNKAVVEFADKEKIT